MKARSFAAKIQTAAKLAQQVAANRPHQISDVQKSLAATREDNVQIESAERALAETNNDPAMLAAVDVSRRALEEHSLRAPAIQRKQLPSA